MSTATAAPLRDHGPREVPTPAPEAPAAAPAKLGFRKRRSTQVFAGLVALAVIGALGAWVIGHGKESTDDAQVEGRVVGISPRVSGQVEKVLVIDNQQVKQGDLLVQLDTRDLDAKLAAARADVESAKANLASAQVNLRLTQVNSEASLRQARGGLTQASSGVQATRSSLAQAKAEVDAAEAADRLAQADWVRAQDLAKAEAISRADIDARRSRAEQARAVLEQARARLSTTEANLASSGGGLTTAQGRLTAAETAPEQVKAAEVAVQAAQARLDQAAAAYDLAALNRSYAEVRAPVDGVVSRRTVEQGQLVGPDRPMLALVPLQDIWVVANFKEDQIGEMKAGQKATVRVDTYGRRDFQGHVESLAGASGARFALLPPDNASGNFVKVVQRVPVLVRLDRAPDVPLRPGMSAVVTVRTN
ncbi:MAG TPA: HlyD family secretion protein [Myxococcaceae bacterium]|nr:HlyD family secretion protein [Myxococcaceae bacterium]